MIQSDKLMSPSISIENMRCGFENRRSSYVFDNFSLAVTRGQIVAIVGRSGVGKSTLLRVIAGLHRSDLGEVSIGVQGESAGMSRIAYVPQSLGLFQRKTVLDNVLVAESVRRDSSLGYLRSRPSKLQRVARSQALATETLDAITALTNLEIAHVADKFPHELSGGQQQRVVLARAIATRSDVLLCDEPFSAFDDPLRVESRRLLRHVSVQSGATTLLVTHNLGDAIECADRIVVLAGSPAQIVADQLVTGETRSDPVEANALATRLRDAM